LRSNGFGFEPEFTAKVARRHCRIYEVPISYSGRTYSDGKKITWRDGVKAIYTIIRYRLDAVAPRDLLAIGVGAAAVADGHFVDSAAPARDLGRELRLEAEAVGPEAQPVEHLPAEGLVAGLHIREVEVGEHVGEEGEEP